MSVAESLTATSLIFNRGPSARLLAELVELQPHDIVVDIGCGPGSAAREAARRGATVVGVDPSAPALRLARRISRWRRVRGVTWLDGTAEHLPVADRTMTVAWALASVHHWADRAAGLAEIHRVLRPGGRVALVERRVRPGARGHAAHGLTTTELEALAVQLSATGFTDVRTETAKLGRKTLLVARGGRG